MANLHLVTGYGGSDHVTAADDGSLNAAIFGSGQYVLNRGNNLAASVVTSNLVRVLDGDLLMQGRHVRLNEGTYVDLTIDNGAQGMNRNDLIVCRYTKNTGTGVEECNLVVIKGTASSDTASDPVHTEGNIITDHAVLNDFPLYRIPIDGLTVGDPEPLFEIANFSNELASLAESINKAQTTANTAVSDAKKAQTTAEGRAKQFWGTYTGDGTTDRVINLLETGKSPSIAVIMRKHSDHSYATDIMVIFGGFNTTTFTPHGFQFTNLGSSNLEFNAAQGICYNGGIKVEGGTESYGFNLSGGKYYVWGIIA